LEDFLWPHVPRVHERDPDARAHVDLLSYEQERLTEEVADPLRDGLGVPEVRDLVQEHGKLVSSEPCDSLPRSKDGLDPLASLDEELVADDVSKRVVDEFEAVNVEEEEARAL
jgi:hypothetical protein